MFNGIFPQLLSIFKGTLPDPYVVKASAEKLSMKLISSSNSSKKSTPKIPQSQAEAIQSVESSLKKKKKEFYCSTCDKAFTTKSSLKKHKTTAIHLNQQIGNLRTPTSKKEDVKEDKDQIQDRIALFPDDYEDA